MAWEPYSAAPPMAHLNHVRSMRLRYGALAYTIVFCLPVLLSTRPRALPVYLAS
jgi:hypothetical protein